MKPCWKDAGLTRWGAKHADEILAKMESAVAIAPNAELARVVLEELIFRQFVLPGRTPLYRAQYFKANCIKTRTP